MGQPIGCEYLSWVLYLYIKITKGIFDEIN